MRNTSLFCSLLHMEHQRMRFFSYTKGLFRKCFIKKKKKKNRVTAKCRYIMQSLLCLFSSLLCVIQCNRTLLTIAHTKRIVFLNLLFLSVPYTLHHGPHLNRDKKKIFEIFLLFFDGKKLFSY